MEKCSIEDDGVDSNFLKREFAKQCQGRVDCTFSVAHKDVFKGSCDAELKLRLAQIRKGSPKVYVLAACSLDNMFIFP